MKNNIITLTDSYKFTHFQQYPKGTEYIYSYFESRNGAKYNKTVFFGLQYYLKEYLQGTVVTREGIEQAAKLCKAHFGTEKNFNRDMWEYILEKYDGKLPISIKAVPEGTPVSVSNVLMTVVNTDPKCAPLTNHLETILSQIWGASTVASLSYETYKLIEFYRYRTGTRNGIKFGLHDFGFRGVSSVESAGVLGAGHLLNFLGTDTVKAMEVAMEYYNAPLDGLAYSVPATEHSVMTARGKEGEEQVFAELLGTYPEGILSVVIDSYDYKNFVNVIVRKYKDVILARNGKLVLRPDSGDPTSVTIDVFNMVADIFGTTKNDKGYKELHPKLGVLWGDGIDYAGIRSILFSLSNNMYSTDSQVFGQGGGLLQKIDRDFQRFAFKSSAQCREGVWYDIFKNPLEVSKVSKKGKLKLIKDEKGDFHTVGLSDPRLDELVEVFRDGVILKEYTFDEVRKNVGTW
jgi:nicotinamide phosphoribosyltransferase